jgi:threonine dehydrogenase-like Zn-dependent dehydrogenase
MTPAPHLLPATTLASVALPGVRSELRSFPLPAAGPDTGWLEVAASGICGTDVGLYARGVAAPVILGHHVVGRIAGLGEQAAQRWGVQPGDRVVLEEYLPCGQCEHCSLGRYRLCPDTDIWGGGRRIGTVPVSQPPGLFGGNAEYLFLPANAVAHRLPPTLSEDLAAWVLPYANAIDWLTGAGALRPGEIAVVLGPGYHGLALVAAANWAGAGTVIAAGLARDAERLAMAEALGARPVVVDGPADLETAVRAATGGRGADVVVDAVGADPSVVSAASALLRHGGRLVLTSPKKPVETAVDTALMVRNALTVRAVRGRPPSAIAEAMASLAEGSSRLEQVPTVWVGLDGVGDMLARLASGHGPESPHVVVRPTSVRH